MSTMKDIATDPVAAYLYWQELGEVLEDFRGAVEAARFTLREGDIEGGCWTGYIIVQREDGSYYIESESPRSPLAGEIMAHVDLDGRVSCATGHSVLS